MEFEERATDPLAGGIMRGYQCGMTWGSALAAGVQAYRILGKSPQAEAWAILAAQRIVEAFRAQNKSINCREITGVDLSAPTSRAIVRFLIKSGPTGSCLGMAARCASMGFGEINAALSQNQIETPAAPVSCSAILAQKMRASDVHTIMAAGLAGGIGLSGGACGALGTAIWLSGINSLEKGTGTVDLKASGDTSETFIQHTSGEFECSKIVGRKFENIDDHASHLQGGGCSKLIEILAAQRG